VLATVRAQRTSVVDRASLVSLNLLALPIWFRGLSDDVNEGMGIVGADVWNTNTNLFARDNKTLILKRVVASA
jgi:hypothetical protein